MLTDDELSAVPRWRRWSTERTLLLAVYIFYAIMVYLMKDPRTTWTLVFGSLVPFMLIVFGEELGRLFSSPHASKIFHAVGWIVLVLHGVIIISKFYWAGR